MPSGTTTILCFVLTLLNVNLNFANIIQNDLDNAVVGSPIVQCEREFIHFSVPTKKPFRGRVYLKGEYGNAECVRIYDALNENESESAEVHRTEVLSSNRKPTRDEVSAPSENYFTRPKNGFANYEQNGNGIGWRDFLKGSNEPSSGRKHRKEECPLVCPPCDENYRHRRQTTSNNAEIDIRLGTCNVQRDRTLNPPGLRVSTVVVVSFHQNFVTKVDKAYRVDCLYEESNRQVTMKIDVSSPQTVELSSEMQPPRCQYRIKTKNGGELKNVRVGEEALHEWTCLPVQSNQDDSSIMKDMFGILVHSCFVDDGQGKRQLVVDSHGCSMDQFILPTPTYASNQLKASIVAPVVKFPDRETVGFQCAISVFMREMGNTPPKCDETRNRTRRSTTHRLEDGWQLHAQQLTVLDPETSIDQRTDNLLNLSPSPLKNSPITMTEFCVSVAAFGLMIASFTFLITLIIGFALATLLLRKQALEDLFRSS